MAVSCRHFLVSGRVQGVFFRGSACDAARELNLTGWVRNLSDGRVEAVACGDATALDAFARWLAHGPPHARVTDVVVREVEPQTYADFSIR